MRVSGVFLCVHVCVHMCVSACVCECVYACGIQWRRRRRADQLEAIYVEQSARYNCTTTSRRTSHLYACSHAFAITSHWSNIRSRVARSRRRRRCRRLIRLASVSFCTAPLCSPLWFVGIKRPMKRQPIDLH